MFLKRLNENLIFLQFLFLNNKSKESLFEFNISAHFSATLLAHKTLGCAKEGDPCRQVISLYPKRKRMNYRENSEITTLLALKRESCPNSGQKERIESEPGEWVCTSLCLFLLFT
jgi:hypothetical protein